MHMELVLCSEHQSYIYAYVDHKSRWLRAAVLIFAFLSAAQLLGQSSVSLQYLYNDRNQLSKVVDSTGIVIEYIYDPVGNILQVNRSTLPGVPGALNIFSFTPQQGGAGTIITLQGQGFSTTPS